MQVSVESTGNIGRKMNISVPVEKIDGEVEKRLKDMRGRVKLDGFRPGKVPLSVVSQQYGDSIYQEVVNEVFQSSFNDAAQSEELRVAGYPTIEDQTIEPGKDLQYTAVFDVYPVFEIANIEELEITKASVEITDADINKMIETLQEQQKEWQDVERAAEKDDLVVVDFDGTIDDESFEGGSAKEFSIEVGAGRMLKEFDDAILGMSAGDDKKVDITFPEDYPSESLKGKTALFDIKVSVVRESTLPTVDEEFIKKFGVDDGSEDAFRTEIKDNMARELEQNIKARLKQSVMDGLHELHDVDLPASLVSEEIKHVRNEMSSNTKGADLSSLPDDLFRDQAARRVKLGLIVGEIITKNDLQKNQQKVNEMLEKMAATYEDPQAFVEYYRTNEQAMQTVEAAVMEEMIVDWVLEKAIVNDEETTFAELMAPPKEQAPAELENKKDADEVESEEKTETV
ncbi:MAG: trigger factor [Cocleimonas sp.]|nr:trigger factor [Cocleimonas sp.]